MMRSSKLFFPQSSSPSRCRPRAPRSRPCGAAAAAAGADHAAAAAATAATSAAAAPSPKALTEEEVFAKKTLAELNAEKPLEDVYFDYDKAELRAEARTSLSKNAEWLKRWASTKVLVEGHCDTRGTNEYNLALGDRRAAAAPTT